MRSFVIKTYFDLFNIVLKSFPRFYTICIKCIEAEVLNLLNLGCLERKKKGAGGAAKTQRGYCPLASLGRNRGFLCRDRAFWFCVATWSFVSRHGSQAAGGWWVATGVFLVATELFSSGFLSRKGSSLSRDSVLFSVMTMSR